MATVHDASGDTPPPAPPAEPETFDAQIFSQQSTVLTDENADPFAESASANRHRATSDVSPAWSLMLGLPLYGAVMGFAHILPESISRLLLERGFIPHIIMLLSCWALAMLGLKATALVRQRRAFTFEVLPEGDAAIGPNNVAEVVSHVRDLSVTQPKQSLLLERVLRILEHYAARGDASETAALNNADADADAAAVASSFSLIKVLIWAIPILGFIGTVIGIGTAVGGFSETLDAAEQLDSIKYSLGEVTSGLAVAFDTTLIALVMSILLMLPTNGLQKAEEKLASDIDDFCVTVLMRRLTNPATGIEARDDSRLLTQLPEVIAQAVSHALNTSLVRMIESNRELMRQLSQSQNAASEQLAQSIAASKRLAASTVAAAEQLETSTTAAAERMETSTKVALEQLKTSAATAAEQLLASNAALARSSAALEQQLSGYADTSKALGPAITEAVAELGRASQEAQRANRGLEQGQQQLCRELGASRQLLQLLAAGMGTANHTSSANGGAAHAGSNGAAAE